MAKFDYGISIKGMVTNLEDIKNQLIKEKFEIDIKLTNSARKVIDELKQVAVDLGKAFSSLGSIPSSVKSSIDSTPKQTGISALEIAQRIKSQEALISQIQSKLNMGTRSGMFDYNSSIDGNSYVGKDIEAGYRKALVSARALKVESKDYKESLVGVQTEVTKLAPAYQAVQKVAQKTYDKTDKAFANFKKKALNFIYYRTISAVFNTIENAAKSIINVTIDINSEVRDINKVLDVTEKQMGALVQNANDLANQYARTTLEVMKAMEYFAKAGYGYSQLQQFAELSIKLQNVGDLSSEASSQFLIAANAAFQFDKNAGKLAKTIDVVNNLSNNAAVTVEFLSEAIKVGGAVAHSAGLSLEEFASMATTVGEATQRGGREVGNGIKTILLRLTQVNDTSEDAQEAISNAEKALGEAGIKVRATANSFRPAMEVLNELAHSWETLTEKEQKAINYNLAGVYRSNILESFLKNIKDYEDNIYIALNSVGSATRENEVYMTSLEAGIKKIKAAWESFVIKLEESKTIKGVLDTVAFAVKNLGTVLENLFYVVMAFGVVKTIRFIKEMGGFAGAFKKAASSAKAFNTTLNSSLGIIGLLTIALTAVVALYKRIDSAAERNFEKNNELIRASKEEMDISIAKYGQMNIVMRQYESLREQYEKTGEGAQELKDLQEELIAQYGVQADGIDLVNGKYEDNFEIMRKIREELLRQAVEEGQEGYSLAKNQSIGGFGLWKDKPSFKRTQTENLDVAFDEAGVDANNYFGLNALQRSSSSRDKYIRNKIRKMDMEEYASMLEMLQSSLSTASKDGDNNSAKQSLDKVNGWLKAANKAFKEPKENMEAFEKNAKDLAQTMASGELVKLQGEESEVYNLFSSHIELLDFTEEGAKQYAEKLKELAGIVDGINVEKVDDVWKKLIKLFPDLKDSDKNAIMDIISNDRTQISDVIDGALGKLDNLKKQVSEREAIQKATATLYDLRRKIADEAGLVGKDYANYADEGIAPQDSKFDKLRKIAKEMQDDYDKYVEEIKKSEAEGLDNQETITKLYETQVKLKEKELAILTKELAIDEKRKSLNRLENERNQVTYINGQAVYTVDYEAISKAKDELLKAEQEKSRAESELQTDINLSQTEKDILNFKDSISEFEVATKDGEKGLVSFLENLNNISDYLKVELKDDLELFSKMLKAPTGVGNPDPTGQTTPIVETAKTITDTFANKINDIFNGSGDKEPAISIGTVNVTGVENLDGLVDEMKIYSKMGSGSLVRSDHIN